jgi:hypothetical protein
MPTVARALDLLPTGLETDAVKTGYQRSKLILDTLQVTHYYTLEKK